MHDLRSKLINRLVQKTKQILHQKQKWLFTRESYKSMNKQSILFLYPIVIYTYDSVYSPVHIHFFEDVTVSKIVVWPILN